MGGDDLSSPGRLVRSIKKFRTFKDPSRKVLEFLRIALFHFKDAHVENNLTAVNMIIVNIDYVKIKKVENLTS